MRRLRFAALLAGFAALAGALTAPAQPPAGWGTIKGQVKLPNAPAPKTIDPTNDKQHCLSKGPLLDTSVIVDAKSKGLKNVIVWLRPDSTDRRATLSKDQINPKLATPKPKEHAIDQPCCQFIPRILAAREGDTLVIKNSSPVPHNTNMSADESNPAFTFNVTLPPGKEFKPMGTLKAQRSPIPFKCDIHQWMKGYLRVFDHPYFAVTDANGSFEIKDAPAGKWRLVYWHENGYHKGREGALGFPIEVKSGGVTQAPVVDFVFPK